jgi:predicted secreted protein
MNVGTILAIYFILWWVVLFAVLPWGTRTQADSGEITPGTDPGAPAVHRVWMKLVVTTVVTSIVFAIFYGAYVYGLIPFDFLKRISNPPHY